MCGGYGIALRDWPQVHIYSSVTSTLFLLMLCVTGLPLIFHDEIDAIGGRNEIAASNAPALAQGGKPLDVIVQRAVSEAGGGVPLFIGFSQDSPLITVTAGPKANAPGDAMRLFSFNRMTGQSVGEINTSLSADF